MLVQLHGQDPRDPTKHMLLMQGDVNSDDELSEWYELCRVKWSENGAICPTGWVPMVCTETSEYFTWMAVEEPDKLSRTQNKTV